MRYFDLDSAELPVLQITYNHLWTTMGADCRVQGKIPMLSTPQMCFQLWKWLVCWCYQPIIGWKCWSTSRPGRHFHLDYKPIPSSSKMSNPPKEPSLVNKLSWSDQGIEPKHFSQIKFNFQFGLTVWWGTTVRSYSLLRDNCKILQFFQSTDSFFWQLSMAHWQLSHWQLSDLTVVRSDSCPIWQLSDLTVVRTDSCPIWQLSDLTDVWSYS